MIVCLDTNIVVYLIEPNPVWTPRAVATLHAAGDKVAVCDAATLECLIHPLATGDAVIEAGYRSFFSNPLVRMPPVTKMKKGSKRKWKRGRVRFSRRKKVRARFSRQ